MIYYNYIYYFDNNDVGIDIAKNYINYSTRFFGLHQASE